LLLYFAQLVSLEAQKPSTHTPLPELHVNFKFGLLLQAESQHSPEHTAVGHVDCAPTISIIRIIKSSSSCTDVLRSKYFLIIISISLKASSFCVYSEKTSQLCLRVAVAKKSQARQS
jgi:hypothetical protein